MGAFHVYEIVQMVPHYAKHFIWRNLFRLSGMENFVQMFFPPKIYISAKWDVFYDKISPLQMRNPIYLGYLFSV